MMFDRYDPNTWPVFRPLIIAHDVGRSRDRSTAVVGGLGPFEPSLVGIKEADELSRAWHGSQDLLSAFLAAVGYVINPFGVTNHPLSIQALNLLPV